MSTYEEYMQLYNKRVKVGEDYQFCKGIREQLESELYNQSGAAAKQHLLNAVKNCGDSWKGPDAEAFTTKASELAGNLDTIAGELIDAVRGQEEALTKEYYNWQKKQNECERNLDDEERKKLIHHRKYDGLWKFTIDNL